jgi:hypothetical protein
MSPALLGLASVTTTSELPCIPHNFGVLGYSRISFILFLRVKETNAYLKDALNVDRVCGSDVLSVAVFIMAGRHLNMMKNATQQQFSGIVSGVPNSSSRLRLWEAPP